jgi:small-conductance mechanosensitive channel
MVVPAMPSALRTLLALLLLACAGPAVAQDATQPQDRRDEAAQPPAPKPAEAAPAKPEPAKPEPAPPPRLAVSPPAVSPPAVSPPAVSPAEAQSALDVLKDDKKRAAFVATLETLTKAAPAAAAVAASPIPLAPDSLGAQVLVSVSRFMEQARLQLVASVGAVRDLPSLVAWAEAEAADPAARDRLADTGWRLAVAMLCGLAAEWGAARLVARPILALATHAPASQPTPVLAESSDDAPASADPASPAGFPGEAGEAAAHRRRRVTPWVMMRRIPFVLARVVLDLLPVTVFAAVAHVVTASALGSQSSTRLVLLAMIDAYVVCRCVMCVMRMVFAPGTPRLRLVHMSDKSAAYLVRWSRRLVSVAVFGYALAEVGLLFGLSSTAHAAVLKVVALLVHVFLGVMVVEKRRAVKAWISAPGDASGVVAAVRNRLARVWHWIALFYIAALWIVYAVEIRDGYARLLHLFVVTTAVMIASRLALIAALGSLDKAMRPRPPSPGRAPGLDERLAGYQPILRALIYGVVAAGCALVLLQVWGLGALDFLTSNRLGHEIVSAIVTIGVTVAVAALVWEAANVGVQRHLMRLTLQAQAARSARLRTLLPMLRTALMLAILTVVTLMVLSEIGINIAPLLAGAGVLGIAVGFGSQKLVQDVITGLFLLLENTMQVGDIVTLGGLTGVVENLSIRAIRLRAEDGSVHVIPFSAVTTVTNMTRDYSQAVIEVHVAYADDYDAVVAVLREIVRDMRAEPRWASEIQDDLEVWGLNTFADNAVVVKCRIKCGPFGRWAVGREFNRRLKDRFDAHGGPDAMRLMLPVHAAAGAAAQPPSPHVVEASPEAKLSAEAKRADAQQASARDAATEVLAREDARAAAAAQREAAE